MSNSWGRYGATVLIGWVILAMAAVFYVQLKGFDTSATLPVVLAFLVEFAFYILAAFDAPREWLANRPKHTAALMITASSVLPWLIYSVPTGRFSPLALVLLVILAGAVAYWYEALPFGDWADAGFLILPASAIIFNVSKALYSTPIPKLDISILGHVMIIRTAALAALTIRGGTGVEFRFLPRRAEWLSGFRWFAILLVPVVSTYWALGLVRLRDQPLNVGLALGTFAGILWVVALSEEFFFRGLLLPWFTKWTRSETAALLVTSVLFGAVHLGFQHKWPNWRFATVAAVAGFFYGMSWRATRSIQSSMVTHALTVTAWRVFLQ